MPRGRSDLPPLWLHRFRLLLVVAASGCNASGSGDSQKPADSNSDSTIDSGGDSPSDTTSADSGTLDLDADGVSSAIIVGPGQYATGESRLPVAAGDVDGDGQTDLLFGMNTWEEAGCGAYGTVYVFGSDTAGVVGAASAKALLCGPSGGGLSLSGQSIAVVGDTDGDGFDDIVVGAPAFDDIGRSYLVRGPVTGVTQLGADSAATLIGHDQDPGEGYAEVYSGYAVAGAGDTNGDGLADVLVSEMNNGYVYLLNGPVAGDVDLRADSDAAFTRDPDLGYFGATVDSAGDVDGDGLADIMIGAVDPLSGAWIFLGPQSGTRAADTADATIESASVYSCKVAGVGDLTGDGLDDVAVSAAGVGDFPAVGGVHLFAGPLAAEVDARDAVASLLSGDDVDSGISFSKPADFDGDGAGDIAVMTRTGSFYYDSVVDVMFGPFAGTIDLTDAPLVLHSSDADDDVGTGLVSPGDVDGDGLAELFVSAAHDDTYGENTGKLWLVAGATMREAAGR